MKQKIDMDARFWRTDGKPITTSDVRLFITAIKNAAASIGYNMRRNSILVSDVRRGQP